MSDRRFTIQQLAELTGATPVQLRAWESEGLITSDRSPQGWRWFAPSQVVVVRELMRTARPISKATARGRQLAGGRYAHWVRECVHRGVAARSLGMVRMALACEPRLHPADREPCLWGPLAGAVRSWPQLLDLVPGDQCQRVILEAVSSRA